ncbi:hypothetical protein [Dactylosporangium sp. CA-139066]|uniref:hypothetical protein n=1 Tax=Dactylosporangium sp. CA-139066 TaxID=3239930 RepID=UPI003D8A9ADF
MVNGAAAWAWAPGGVVYGIFLFTVDAGLITAIDIVGDPASIAALRIELPPL